MHLGEKVVGDVPQGQKASMRTKQHGMDCHLAAVQKHCDPGGSGALLW
jgi:hypothetical protein